MDGATTLIIGKALIWFAIPLIIAVWELISLGRDNDD